MTKWNSMVRNGEELWLFLGKKVNGYVKTGGMLSNYYKATPRMLVSGNIERSALGGAVIYDKNGRHLGMIHVDYAGDKAIALTYKDEMIAARSD